MDWKEFLKPTKGKIVAFVITLILSSIYIYFAVDIPCPLYEPSGPGDERRPPCEDREGLLPEQGIFFIILPIFILGLIPVSGFLKLVTIILSVILNVIWLYFIGVLLLYFLEKFRNKE